MIQVMHQSNTIEKLISQVDIALRTLMPPKQRQSLRISPAQNMPESELCEEEKKLVAGLMRVNHAGEVCAQALYQGQALTAKLTSVRTQMTMAAQEEIDHLAWCEQRLCELHSHTSALNILWYSGSFFIGALAGIAGDRWSLGFVAETERQVTAHLQHHLSNLPKQDLKTQAIVTQMQIDETQHADCAQQAGAAELPLFIKQAMKGVSKLLTYGSYYI
jgi:ubiquinone biosynthesis monooxygenase Coq7